ncbi:hypothetical protein ACPPVO_16965 [Dactylosporangium sp. McL0621]|uniref:hypothetical protein n=1 Tax=Dactylosporangium sp. McL0621 TaxID=3415678 RepID=UPI003CF16EF0
MVRTGTLGWVAGAATAVLVAGGGVLGVHVGNLHNGLIAASFTLVGLYVVRRRPGNAEGWLPARARAPARARGPALPPGLSALSAAAGRSRRRRPA